MAFCPHRVKTVVLEQGWPRVDCHPEQAFFARRGIWASRAMRRVLCDAITARLARFPIELSHRENDHPVQPGANVAFFTKRQSPTQCYRETGRFCHPERSNCFAQRSGCGVEGPLPAQIGRRASGNSPMLAPTNSLRQPTSRSVSVPA